MNYDYNLESDEAILLVEEDCVHNKRSGDLVLTNHYLVHISETGLFKKQTVTEKYSLNDIDVFNDKVKSMINEDEGILTLYINRTAKKFELDDLSIMKKWVSAINQVAVDHDYDMDKYKPKTITEKITGFASSFINKISGKQQSDKPEKVVVICGGCGAKISGTQGKISKCPYCDSPIKL